MKRITIGEAKFVSLFKTPESDNFYQDGDFHVTNDKINKARTLFYPLYQKMYGDKEKAIHQIAFSKTIQMIDNGKDLPEFGDVKKFHSIGNIPFSPKQVEYVEKMIYPQFKDMSLEELYDYMLIEQERSVYNTNIECKKAVASLINQGFFDSYLGGNVKDVAMWSIGKLNSNNDMLAWLYSKNRFTKDLNFNMVMKELDKTCGEIADSDESFMKNEQYLAVY